jgi:hypothetical protein
MNYSDILQSLNQASAFDLYRLRAAIDRVLDEPRWLQAIGSRLHVGLQVQYFDPQANRLRTGVVLEVRRKQAVIRDDGDGKRWLIEFPSINLDRADVRIREQVRQGLGRNELAVGDVVGFLDRQQQQRTGQILRLNDKTVTLQSGQQQWRVAYAFLHRILDVDAAERDVRELPAA